jgi:hypothetical protein
MSHPDLIAQLIGRRQPSRLGALRASQLTPEAPTAQSDAGEQGAEACRLTRVGRWSVDCTVHGRVRVDEMSYPRVCQVASEGKR